MIFLGFLIFGIKEIHNFIKNLACTKSQVEIEDVTDKPVTMNNHQDTDPEETSIDLEKSRRVKNAELHAKLLNGIASATSAINYSPRLHAAAPTAAQTNKPEK